MTQPPDFDDMIRAFEDDPSVGPSDRRGFARASLMKNGKMFVSVRGDRMLLKLPADRVEAIIASAQGEPFDANRGKPLKEWVVVTDVTGLDWIALAREAARFVS